MNNHKLIFALVLLLCSAGQVASDLYLPSLPAITANLNTTISYTQLSVSLYMFGLAISPLFFGPLSDGIGRRKPLLIGLALSLVGSIMCAAAPSIFWLVLGRFIQGLGLGGASVSRSIFPDVFETKDLARYSSFLSIGNVTLIAAAPMVGGYLEHYFGWRSNFFFLTSYMLAIWIFTKFALPETNIHLHPDNLKLSVIKKNFVSVLTNPFLMGYITMIMLLYATILAWLTSGSFILQHGFGLTPIQFGWIAIGVGATFVLSSFVNGHLVRLFSLNALITAGLVVMALAAAILWGICFFGTPNLWTIVIPVGTVFLGVAFVFANVFAKAAHHFGKIAGMATAIVSFFQITGGGIASAVLAYIPNKSAIPFTTVIFVCCLLSVLCHWLLARKELVER